MRASEEFGHTVCGHRTRELRMSLGDLFLGESVISQGLRTQVAPLEILPPESPRICDSNLGERTCYH